MKHFSRVLSKVKSIKNFPSEHRHSSEQHPDSSDSFTVKKISRESDEYQWYFTRIKLITKKGHNLTQFIL